MEAQWYDSPITGNVQLSWVRIVQSCMTASTHIWSPDLWSHWHLNTANCTNLFSLRSLQLIHNPIFELWSWLEVHIVLRCVTAQGWHPFPYLIDINHLSDMQAISRPILRLANPTVVRSLSATPRIMGSGDIGSTGFIPEYAGTLQNGWRHIWPYLGRTLSPDARLHTKGCIFDK